jgi:hypothetical protein
MAAWGQVNVRTAPTAGFLIRPHFGAWIPGGDVGETFGSGLETGLSLGYKWPSNWILTGEGSFLFGSNVKIGGTVFSQIQTDLGYLLNSNGQYSLENVNMRGWSAGVHVAKITGWLGHNPSSGIIFGLGGGYLRHWMGIKYNQEFIPQISGEYAKGYDRMHGGMYLRQSAGYHHAGNKRKINFLLTLEFTQAFTTNLRGFNFDTEMADTQSKLDFFSGLRFTWFFPMYEKGLEQYYYY